LTLIGRLHFASRYTSGAKEEKGEQRLEGNGGGRLVGARRGRGGSNKRSETPLEAKKEGPGVAKGTQFARGGYRSGRINSDKGHVDGEEPTSKVTNFWTEKATEKS